MKKNVNLLLFFLLLGCFINACGQKQEEKTQQGDEEIEKVLKTFKSKKIDNVTFFADSEHEFALEMMSPFMWNSIKEVIEGLYPGIVSPLNKNIRILFTFVEEDLGRVYLNNNLILLNPANFKTSDPEEFVKLLAAVLAHELVHLTWNKLPVTITNSLEEFNRNRRVEEFYCFIVTYDIKGLGTEKVLRDFMIEAANHAGGYGNHNQDIFLMWKNENKEVSQIELLEKTKRIEKILFKDLNLFKDDKGRKWFFDQFIK